MNIIDISNIVYIKWHIKTLSKISHLIWIVHLENSQGVSICFSSQVNEGVSGTSDLSPHFEAIKETKVVGERQTW